jgi:hypothetical protein
MEEQVEALELQAKVSKQECVRWLGEHRSVNLSTILLASKYKVLEAEATSLEDVIRKIKNK